MEIRDDLADRLARVQTAMRERGLGGLILYSRGQHTMLRMDQLRYLSGFKTLGPAALLVPARGEPTLVTTPAWDLPRARETVSFAEIRAVHPGDLAAAIVAVARNLSGTLALAGGETMPLAFARELNARFGTPPQEAGDLVTGLATARTAAELARVTRAAAIADEGFAALCAAAHVGMTEYELAAEIEAVMQAAGSEDNYGLLGAGHHNLAIRAPSERLLEAGDVIVGEITPCFEGQFAQLCRSLVLGEPSTLQQEKYNLLMQAEDAGFAAAVPGRPSSDIARAVNGVIAAAGYGEFCRQPYMRTRGHGLGFGGVIPYDVTEDRDTTLQPNMTMVIHPNQYFPDVGYLMLGDTVVIEAQGPRALTVTQRQLFWKAV